MNINKQIGLKEKNMIKKEIKIER